MCRNKSGVIKKIHKYLSLLVIFTILFPCSVIAEAQRDAVKIYFFYGEGCPHCESEKVFFSEIKNKYPDLQILPFEVWHNKDNFIFFERMAAGFGIEVSGVPTTFIGDRVFVGYSKQIALEMGEKIKECVNVGCVDPLTVIDKGIRDKELFTIKIPYLGEINPKELSLPALAIILGGLDSFNPCAFFVLLFLLSLLIHAKSRKTMFIIGGVFVFFSGLLYFVFMAAWLNLFLLVGQLPIITLIAAIIAITIAAINIKDFFFFKKGVSLVIPEKAKPKIYERMRNLLRSTSITSMFFGTGVLAIVVNTYELICTAGFPMVFTRALTLHNLTTLQYYSYLLLYNVVFVIPLLIIVLIMAITLGAKKLTEWQGRVLKLISGTMMLGMGLILLIKPILLNNAIVSVLLLAVTLLTSGIIVFIAKRIKPEIKEGF